MGLLNRVAIRKLFGPPAPAPEAVADAARLLERKAEAEEALKKLRAISPGEHLKNFLEAAGLPGDLETVKRGGLLVRIPWGNVDHIYLVQILGVHIFGYETLEIYTTEGFRGKPMRLRWSDDGWMIIYYNGIDDSWTNKESTWKIHHIELL